MPDAPTGRGLGGDPIIPRPKAIHNAVKPESTVDHALTGWLSFMRCRQFCSRERGIVWLVA